MIRFVCILQHAESAVSVFSLATLRGLRVRMGLHTGIHNDADVTYNKAAARMQYSGEILVQSKAVSDCAAGGMILLSEVGTHPSDYLPPNLPVYLIHLGMSYGLDVLVQCLTQCALPLSLLKHFASTTGISYCFIRLYLCADSKQSSRFAITARILQLSDPSDLLIGDSSSDHVLCASF